MSVKKDLREYRDVVASLRVQHDAYRKVMGELRLAYDDVGQSATPICLLILGETRTGKSCVATDMLDMHVETRCIDHAIRSVIYAVTPPKATVKALLECLLQGLRDPHWNRGTVSNMTQRLYTLLAAAQCRMIVLDEFQHLCASDERGEGGATGKRPHRRTSAMSERQKMTANWLKVLLERTGLGLVAIGLPEAMSVVQTNRQLSGRFDPPLRLPVFDWKEDASKAQFLGILRQFQVGMRPFQLPRLDADPMGLRMYLASAGRIGQLARLLDRAVRTAILAQTTKIRLEDLGAAYHAAIWSAPLFPVGGGPFGAAVEKLLLPAMHEQVLANASKEPYAAQAERVKIYGAAQGGQPSAQTALPAGRQGGRSADLRKRPPVSKRSVGRKLEGVL